MKKIAFLMTVLAAVCLFVSVNPCEAKDVWVDRWQNINIAEGRAYQLNAYRVLLTRARQGMVICIPKGDPTDATRLPEFYDSTYDYFKGLGLKRI